MKDTWNPELKLVTQFIYGLNDGGAEALVRDYTMELERKGYKTEVLLRGYDESSNNYRFLKDNELEVINLTSAKDYQNRKILTRICRHLKIIHGVNQYIRNKRPDIIHVHLDLLKYLAFAPLEKTHIFYTVHNPVKDFFIEKQEFLVAKRLIKTGKITFIALQEELARETNEFFNIDSTKVLYNGVYLNKFRYSTKWRKSKREELHIPKNAFVIGHIGRFADQKNQMFLLDVFQKITKKKKDAVLLCVGAGKTLPKFQYRVEQYGLEDRVVIVSKRTDIPELISTMDRFVFPSIFEGFGIVLIEVQSEGIPCIVSDRVSNRVCVSDHFYKLSLEKSVEEWADATLKAPLSNVPISDIKNFDMNIITNHLIDYYEESR